MTARIPARSERQAMDWSLVLVSQGIETTIDSDPETGWGLIVPEPDRDRAVETLEQYRRENPRWPWRQEIPRHGILFDWGSLGWVLLAGVFFFADQFRDLHDAGMMDATVVARGEWWRLFTAIFLHADLSHLLANATLGFLLLGLTMGRYGTGLGLLAAYLAGAGGNVIACLAYPEGHLSRGASGMVMGCIGLLAVQSALGARKSAQARKYLVTGIAGGVMLFTLTGLSPEPRTDVVAHFGGFVSGLLAGAMLALVPRLAKNPAANLVAGIVFAAMVLLTWWLTLTR